MREEQRVKTDQIHQVGWLFMNVNRERSEIDEGQTKLAFEGFGAL
jgi:hypothetical protein